MAKKPPNHGKDWSAVQVRQFRQLVARNTPVGILARMTGRTVLAVQGKAYNLGLSLRPVKKSPQNRLPR